MMPTLTWPGAFGLSMACRSGTITFLSRSTWAGSTVFWEAVGVFAAGGGRARGPPVAGAAERGFEGAAAEQGRRDESAADDRPRAHRRSRVVRAGRMAS